jgi:methionyl-tRNA formyltransferase
MGTPEFSVPALEAVSRKFSVVGVYTQPDKPVGRGLGVKASPVKLKAVELGIPVFQPEKLSLPGQFEQIQSLNPDVIVIVAYGQILRKNILNLPRLGCINIHSSLLPRWRGAAPIQWSILSGDAETGISTMHLVEKLDAGDVLLQKSTPISSEDTATTVHDRLAQIGAELIVPTLEGLESGTLQGRTQDESAVTYASKLTKEMEWLDPNEPAEVLDRKIRALNPWPGTSLNVGQRLKVKRATLHPKIQGPAGKIFERSGMIMLGTSRGALELLALQWDGKKEVDPGGFLNGLRGKGTSLPLEVVSESILV